MFFLHLGLYFMLFSFGGWLLEVCFHAAKNHAFVNRGFNNGPVCPIYGFGIALLYLLLGDLRERWLLLYAASVLIASLIELATGVLLDRVFHTKWWDYSAERFNLGGFICLKFSLVWGVFCTLIVKLLFTPIDSLFAVTPPAVLIPLESLFFLLLLCDTVMSVLKAIGFNRELAALDKLAGMMRTGSDRLGKKVSDGTILMDEQYRRLQENTDRLYRRLLDAFPTMRSFRYNEQLTALKVKRRNRRKKKESEEK